MCGVKRMNDTIKDLLPIWALGFIAGFFAGVTVGLWAYSTVPV